MPNSFQVPFSSHVREQLPEFPQYSLTFAVFLKHNSLSIYSYHSLPPFLKVGQGKGSHPRVPIS